MAVAIAAVAVDAANVRFDVAMRCYQDCSPILDLCQALWEIDLLQIGKRTSSDFSVLPHLRSLTNAPYDQPSWPVDIAAHDPQQAGKKLV